MTTPYHKRLYALPAAVILLFAYSCGEHASAPKNTAPDRPSFSAAAFLAKDTIGFFRGAEFGDEAGTIRQMENDSFLVFDSPALLKYEYKLPGDRHYKLEYTFKKNKLSSFNFDLFPASETEAENLTLQLKDWFRKRFGDGVTQMGVFVWPLAASEYKESYLELRDESSEFGYGKVNITAYAIR